MGLDLVELVMRIEDAFGIAIPDKEASRLLTPDDVAAFILTRLEVSDRPLPCLSQTAFHLLRRHFTQTLHVARRHFTPDAPLTSLLPESSAQDAWERIGRDTGLKGWPSIRPRWFGAALPRDRQTVRGLIDHLLSHDPLGVKSPERKWTKAQVEDILRRVIQDETGIKNFTGSSRFVDDMGLD